MSMGWLEPAIEKRVNEIFDNLFENELVDLYEEYMNIIGSVPDVPPDLVFKLENLFILGTRQRIDVCYRAGLKQGLIDGISAKIDDGTKLQS